MNLSQPPLSLAALISSSTLAAALLMAVATGWADEPSTPNAKTEAATERTPAKPDDGVAANEVTAAPIATPGKRPFKPPAGYKLKRVNGEDFYCAKLYLDGSRLSTQVCRTEAELREIKRTNQSMRNELERRSHPCEGVGCMRR